MVVYSARSLEAEIPFKWANEHMKEYMHTCVHMYTYIYIYIHIEVHVEKYTTLRKYICIYLYTYICVFSIHIHQDGLKELIIPYVPPIQGSLRAL